MKKKLSKIIMALLTLVLSWNAISISAETLLADETNEDIDVLEEEQSENNHEIEEDIINPVEVDDDTLFSKVTYKEIEQTKEEHLSYDHLINRSKVYDNGIFYPSDWSVEENGDVWTLMSFNNSTRETVYIPSFYGDKQIVINDLNILKNKNIKKLRIEAVGSESNPSDIQLVKTNSTNADAWWKDDLIIEELYLSGLDVSNITSLNQTFMNTSNLHTIDVSQWNVIKVKTMRELFRGMSKVRDLDVSKWPSSNVLDYEYAFADTTNLFYLDLSNWEADDWRTKKSNMFSNSGFMRIYLGIRFADIEKSNISPGVPAYDPYLTGRWVKWDESIEYGDSSSFESAHKGLYAKYGTYHREGLEYPVTYKYKTVDGIDKEEIKQHRFNMPFKTQLVPQATNYADYTFVGWKHAETREVYKKLNDFEMEHNPVTFEAVYTQAMYDLSFNVDGIVTSYEYPANVSLRPEDIPEVPKKDGYTFVGWKDSLTQKVYKSLDDYVTTNKNVTLTTQFEINQHEVIFKVDDETSQYTAYYDSLIDLSLVPVVADKKGHTFVGWKHSISGDVLTDLSNVKVPDEDLTFVAVFAANAYALSFDIDGVVKEIFVDYETSPQVETVPTPPDKTGYTFVGWRSSYDDALIKDLSAFKMPDEAVVLTAEYKIKSLVLTFESLNEVMKSITLNYDAMIPASEIPEDPTRPGYTFVGWMHENQVVEDLESFKMPAEDTTLVAQFEKNSYVVSFVIEDETTSYTGLYNDSIDLNQVPSNPSKEGFEFIGWSNNVTNDVTKDLKGIKIPSSDITFTAEFKVRAYDMIFKVDDKTVAHEKVNFKEHLLSHKIPEQPVKVGYEFIGWKDSINHELTVNIEEFIMPAQNVVFTAEFRVNPYTLTVNDQGKTHELVVDYNTSIASEDLPQKPYKEGYDFIGYRSSYDGRLIVNIETFKMPASDTTLTAEFEIKEYRMNFVVEETQVKHVNVVYQEKINPSQLPQEPELKGHHFVGWKNDYNNQVSKDLQNFVMPARDVVFTAVFEVNNYNVTFDVEGETNSYSGAYDSLIDVTKVPTNPEKEGHNFIGWENSVTKEVKKDLAMTRIPDQDVVFTAEFTVNSYKASFVVENETVFSKNLVYDTGFEVEDIPADPIKKGHTFIGWRNSDTLEIVTDFTDFRMPDTFVVFTAVFDVNSYKVTFDDQGTQTYYDVKYNQRITKYPETPIKEGHTFVGYRNSVDQTLITEFDEFRMPDQDVTFTAEFTINSYNLSYVIDQEIVSTFSIQYAETLKDTEIRENPSKEGYQFIGWKNSVDNLLITDLEYFVMPANHVQLFAVFEIEHYTVSFDVDGQISSYRAEFNSSLEDQEIPKHVDKEGYEFVGWKYSEEEDLISDLSQIRVPAKDITFTAVYKINKYRLTFDVSGVQTSQNIDYGTRLTESDLPNNLEKEGHTFIGFRNSLDDSLITDITQFTMPASSLTLTAEYTINSYVLKVVDQNEETSLQLQYNQAIKSADLPKEPSKIGYKFEGWRQSETQELLLDLTTFRMPANDVTLTAEFSIRSYNVKFVVDGIEEKAIALDYNQAFAEGDVPSPPSKEGHTFIGWENSATKEVHMDLSDFVMPNSDVVMNAKFSVNQYTITFDVEGNISTKTLNYGTQLTDVTTPDEPSKKGYRFVGWRNSDTDELIIDLKTQKVVAKEITYTAEFEVNSYDLTFIVEDNEKTVAINYEDNIDLTQVPQIPNKVGYTFVGWKSSDDEALIVDLSTFVMPDNDVTLSAVYEINKYKIEFMGKNTSGSITLDYGSVLDENLIPEVINPEGYTFVGWRNNVTHELSEDLVGYEVQDYDVVFVAEFKVNQYTLTLVDGTERTTLELDYQNGISVEDLPETPSKEGHEFIGWRNNQTTNIVKNIEEFVMPASDVTLTAEFRVNPYVLTIDDQGDIDTIVVSYQEQLEHDDIPQEPKKEGHTFVGYRSSYDQALIVDITEFRMPAQDVTLVAEFTINSYTLDYVVDDNIVQTRTIVFNNNLSDDDVMSNPTKEGYTFKGWRNSLDNTLITDLKSLFMPADNLVLTAEFQVNTYKVNFDVEGSVESFDLDYGTKLTFTVIPDDPTRIGHTFVGWKNSYTDEIISNLAGVKVEAYDVTYTAVFEVNMVSVTVDVDGNVEQHDFAYATVLTQDDFSIDTDKEGYTFIGYRNSLTNELRPQLEAYVVTEEDVVFTAEYEINSYHVIFDNDGKESSVRKEYQSLLAEDDIPKDLTKEGYKFVAWISDEGIQYDDLLSQFTVPSKDTVFTAIYEIQTYTITFTIGDKTYEVLVDYQDQVPAKDIPEAPEKEGYTFVGWKEPKTQIVYTDLSDDFEMFAHNITLEPYYEINIYTVEFQIGDEVYIVQAPHGSYISAKDMPQAPHREGYEFVGWKIISNRSDVFFDADTDQITSDMILEAIYKELEPTVDDDNSIPTGVSNNSLMYINLILISLILLITQKKRRRG